MGSRGGQIESINNENSLNATNSIAASNQTAVPG